VIFPRSPKKGHRLNVGVLRKMDPNTKQAAIEQVYQVEKDLDQLQAEEPLLYASSK
jgi:hypothetical protein